jgi:class 3 adenylate cyclase
MLTGDDESVFEVTIVLFSMNAESKLAADLIGDAPDLSAETHDRLSPLHVRRHGGPTAVPGFRYNPTIFEVHGELFRPRKNGL